MSENAEAIATYVEARKNAAIARHRLGRCQHLLSMEVKRIYSADEMSPPSDWPPIEDIAKLIAAYKGAYGAMIKVWERVPVDVRSHLQPPIAVYDSTAAVAVHEW